MGKMLRFLLVALTACAALVAAVTPLSVSADRAVPPQVIAYVGADGNIWRIDGRGDNKKQLTFNDGTAETPSWSIDGRRIVYSTRKGHIKAGVAGTNAQIELRQVYIMNADGSGTEKLSNSKSDDSYPTFTPDNKRILFLKSRNWSGEAPSATIQGVATSATAAREVEIGSMKADGSDYKAILKGRSDANESIDTVAPRMSPDKKSVVYLSRLGNGSAIVRVIDAKTGAPQRETPSAAIQGVNAPEVVRTDLVAPRYLPDGRIAVIRINYDRDGGTVGAASMVALNAQNGAEQIVLNIAPQEVAAGYDIGWAIGQIVGARVRGAGQAPEIYVQPLAGGPAGVSIVQGSQPAWRTDAIVGR